MKAMNVLQDKLKGGLVGLLIGDALGVPYEFHPPECIPPPHRITFDPPKGFPRSHFGIASGTWSDDGAQAMCLLASLVERGRFDLGDFSRRLFDWAKNGYMAIGGHVFDIGTATETALFRRLARGIRPEKSGLTGEYSNGNGSLMRVLPLALWHTGTDDALIIDAHRQSLVTHRHIRSQVCCALYCLYARRVLEGESDPWQNAFESLCTLYADSDVLAKLGPFPYAMGTDVMKELERIADYDAKKGPTGSGYVVDSLIAAKHAWPIPTYTEAVRWAISLGHDTDTTACIVGGIIGLRVGYKHIPKAWVAKMCGQDMYRGPLELLFRHRRNRWKGTHNAIPSPTN